MVNIIDYCCLYSIKFLNIIFQNILLSLLTWIAIQVLWVAMFETYGTIDIHQKKSWKPWIFHYMPVTQSPLNKGVNFMHGMLHEAIITLTKNPLIQQKYWSDMFAKEIHGCVPFLSFIFYPSLILTTPSFAGRCWKGLWYLLTKVSARCLQVLNRSSFSMQWLLRTFISNLFI